MKTILILALLLASNAYAGPSRSKVLDFEDDVVEGMNKKPLDSLQQLSDRNKRGKRVYLYRKRRGFAHETSESLNELRYSR